MSSLRHFSTSPDGSLRFFRRQREPFGMFTRAVVTVPTAADAPYMLLLRNDDGAEMLLAGPVPGDVDALLGALRQIAVEAGFAESVVAAIGSHGAVRMRRAPDGATSLERAFEPRTARGPALAGQAARHLRQDGAEFVGGATRSRLS